MSREDKKLDGGPNIKLTRDKSFACLPVFGRREPIRLRAQSLSCPESEQHFTPGLQGG